MVLIILVYPPWKFPAKCLEISNVKFNIFGGFKVASQLPFHLLRRLCNEKANSVSRHLGTLKSLLGEKTFFPFCQRTNLRVDRDFCVASPVCCFHLTDRQICEYINTMVLFGKIRIIIDYQNTSMASKSSFSLTKQSLKSNPITINHLWEEEKVPLIFSTTKIETVKVGKLLMQRIKWCWRWITAQTNWHFCNVNR